MILVVVVVQFLLKLRNSIDYDENAVELTKTNLKKFNLSNVCKSFGN